MGVIPPRSVGAERAVFLKELEKDLERPGEQTHIEDRLFGYELPSIRVSVGDRHRGRFDAISHYRPRLQLQEVTARYPAVRGACLICLYITFWMSTLADEALWEG